MANHPDGEIWLDELEVEQNDSGLSDDANDVIEYLEFFHQIPVEQVDEGFYELPALQPV